MRNAIKVLAATGLVLGTALQAEQVATPQVQTPPPKININASPPPPSKSRVASPTGNPGNWVSNNDYPPASLRAGHQGVTGFRLRIDPQGMPTACELTSSSGFAELDATTCSLMMRRARFIPALDIKGRPTTGTYSSRFRWGIPKYDGPLAIKPGTRIMSYVIEPNGLATQCQVLVNGIEQPNSVTAGPCDGRTRYEPVLDASGSPVRKRVTVTMKIETSDP